MFFFHSAIQKKEKSKGYPWFQNEYEISLPDFVPVLLPCSTWWLFSHDTSSADNIKCNIKCKLFCINVSIWCEHDTKTGCSNGYFLLEYMSEPILLYFNLSKQV